MDRPPVGEGDRHGQVERPGGQVVGESADRADVGEVGRLGFVEVHGAGDAAVPPLVLVLDVRGVGPLDDPDRQAVLARPNEIGDVELGCQVGVLGDPGLLAVERHDGDALGRPEVQDDARPADPGAAGVRIPLEGPLVEARRVRVRHVGRQGRERHLDVRVLGQVVEALHRPGAGHDDLRPIVGRFGVGPWEELEPPPAVQRPPPVPVHGRVHRQASAAGQLRVEPGGSHGLILAWWPAPRLVETARRSPGKAARVSSRASDRRAARARNRAGSGRSAEPRAGRPPSRGRCPGAARRRR